MATLKRKISAFTPTREAVQAHMSDVAGETLRVPHAMTYRCMRREAGKIRYRRQR